MQGNETSIMFDMRAPDFGAPITDLYAAALEMAAFADDIGIDRVGLMEHHASNDGYLPAPFAMAGAVAAVTKRIRITLGAVILPLHDPVKIAEQLAVVDLISGGRVEVIFGAGYVPSEFARFKVSLRDRGRLLDEGIDIILRALSGEKFEADGREVFVRPLPVQRPTDMILGGGGVPASARRAARFGIGFSPLRSDLIPMYEEECRKLGREPGKTYGAGLPLNIHVAEDPDAIWPLIAPHYAHVARAYAKWAEEEGDATSSPFSGMDSVEALRSSGLFTVWTPEETLARAPGLFAIRRQLGFMPLIGGLSPEHGWKSLELVRDKILPYLPTIREATGGA
jgi:alkanesulfonate monooxygenase SsuD/methylene tetrahydromethanopterin reductase-like flavin-dependent oxidoreductase (luciferase family)